MDKSKLDSLRDFFDRVIGKTAEKCGNQRHLVALRNGMLFTLPFTLLGGIFMILAFPPVPTGLENTNIFYGFLLSWKDWAANTSLLLVPYYLTIGITSIYVVIGVAYNLAKAYNLNAIYTSTMSLFVFLTIAVQPTKGEDGMLMPMKYLDANGMFTAIIIAIFTVEVCRFLLKHNVKIKMPDSVPPMVTSSFEMLIPLAISLISVLALNEICINVIDVGLVGVIQVLIQPILSATDSLPSLLLVNILVMGFWFFGIHGASMLASIVGPIQAMNLVSNATAYSAGETLPYVFAGSFKSIFATVIMYNALLFAVLIFAKSARLKSLSKVALIPNIFNINEPMLFGLPVVMNVTLIIPILVTVILNTSVFYIAMASDFIGKVFISLTPTIPGPINAYLTTMDWKAPVLWIILCVVNIIIFMPFVKKYDEEILLEEANEVK